MPLMRRRPLMGAAMVGGTAYVAGKAGARAGAAAQQQAAAPPAQPAPAPAPPPAAPTAAPTAAAPEAESSAQKMAELEQLKHLLDAGVLTQAEFDAQKLRILSSL